MTMVLFKHHQLKSFLSVMNMISNDSVTVSQIVMWNTLSACTVTHYTSIQCCAHYALYTSKSS